jgi:hypothetical protein
MAEHNKRPAGDPRKDYDKTSEDVRERNNQADIAPNQRTDQDVPEIKGEGGARGKSGGSSQDGNQENTRRENNGKN